MAKSRKLEELIAAVEKIRHEPASELGVNTLHQALGSRHPVAIAQAAHIIGHSELHDFIPDLVNAFDRCLIKPADSDPGCRAKQAIADALYRLEYSSEALFLNGIRHIQKELVWGGQVDTAPQLRGTCALGLVRMNYSQVMVELGDLLADPEPEARIGAARAIAYSENYQGIPLLRLRVKIGDTAPVLLECLTALLKLASISSLPLLKDLLYARKESGLEEDVERAEAAALALGDSRLAEVFPVLRDWWQRIRDHELRCSGLLAIATLRQPEAIDFLLALVADGMTKDAKSAIRALSIYQHDQVIWERLTQTVCQRQNDALRHVLEQI